MNALAPPSAPGVDARVHARVGSGLGAPAAAVVRGALGAARGVDEVAGAVGAATVGHRRVVGPRVAVDQRRAVRAVQARRVRGAEAEDEVGDLEDVVRAGLHDRAGGDRVRVRVVVVLEDPARDVDRGGACVEELTPVAGDAPVGLDLVDPDQASATGVSGVRSRPGLDDGRVSGLRCGVDRSSARVGGGGGRTLGTRGAFGAGGARLTGRTFRSLRSCGADGTLGAPRSCGTLRTGRSSGTRRPLRTGRPGVSLAPRASNDRHEKRSPADPSEFEHGGALS